jgi:hypothetical protein
MQTEDPVFELTARISVTSDPFIPLGVGRVRYSRINNVPKNSLYTLQMDKKTPIYFGISRCKLNEDACVKKVGRNLALKRAMEAVDAYQDTKAKFFLDNDGLAGRCDPEFLPLVQKYFYDLDRSEEDDDYYA